MAKVNAPYASMRIVFSLSKIKLPIKKTGSLLEAPCKICMALEMLYLENSESTFILRLSLGFARPPSQALSPLLQCPSPASGFGGVPPHGPLPPVRVPHRFPPATR